MTATTWSHLAGDTRVFAFEVAFHSDTESEHVADDVRLSWGSFALYVAGRNVCAQVHEGETLQRVHWYLLPLFEWLVEHWDAIFHEERLPELERSRSPALSAADFDRRAQDTELVHDEDSWSLLERWQSWLERHHLVQGADGGLFPDVFLRRLRDELEVSVGRSQPAGSPDNWFFLHQPETFRVPIDTAAVALHEVLDLATAYLLARSGDSARLRTLREGVKDLQRAGEDAFRRRLGWLVGNDQALSVVFETDPPEPNGASEADALVVSAAPASALMFGSYDPSLVEQDLGALREFLRRSAGRSADAGLLDSLRARLQARPRPPHVEHPGEEGGWFGDELFDLLGGQPDAFEPVDVDGILAEAGVEVESIELRDRRLRGVSIVGRNHPPAIGVNTDYFRGSGSAVQRFTVAHELGHLLHDAAQAREWGVTSGPWAPRHVEQRANGFAAAVLMPKTVLMAFADQAGAHVTEPEVVRGLASRLEVSATSLVDRLRNVGLVPDFIAEDLKGEVAG